jgi:hypothetical protein
MSTHRSSNETVLQLSLQSLGIHPILIFFPELITPSTQRWPLKDNITDTPHHSLLIQVRSYIIIWTNDIKFVFTHLLVVIGIPQLDAATTRLLVFLLPSQEYCHSELRQ